MANTTNLNLVKLSGSEKLKNYPTVQAGNMDIIDAALGAGFGLSGNQSVNTSINNLADGLAIVANGNTHAAITSGQYVYVRNHGSLSEGLYVATANISANGTLSGSNLTADSSGGLNSVYASLNSKIALVPSGSQYTTLDSIKSFLEGINATLADNEYKEVRVSTGSPTNLSPFEGYGYYTGTLTRFNSTTFVCDLVSLTGSTVTINKAGTSWNINSLSSKIATSSVSGKQYIRKSGNNVTINLTDNTIADLIQYTIPEGFRPYLRVRGAVIVRSLTYTNTSLGWIQIDSTGAISLRKVTNNGGTEEITTGYVEGIVSWNV